MHGFLAENLYGKTVTNVQQDAIKLKVKRPSLVEVYPAAVAESSTGCSSNTSSSPARVLNVSKSLPSKSSLANPTFNRQKTSIEEADNISTPTSSNDSTLKMKTRKLSQREIIVNVDLNDKA